jgi:SRSO17 transposase
MTIQQIAGLGKQLAAFLALFNLSFRSRRGFALLRIYVQGLLSDIQRKNVEAIALAFNKPPRTLQRFIESIKWNEEEVRDACQRLVANEHAHADAIGCLDESGTAKSGTKTVGVARQWLGSCGKVDNGIVGVHLSYGAPGFQCLLDSEIYLTEEWIKDAARRKKAHVPDEVVFRTKAQIGLELIDRALGHGVRVRAWTFDEGYGRDTGFLDALEERGQVYVAEVPTNFHGWAIQPQVLQSGSSSGRGRKKKYPRLARAARSSEVQNLLRYSPTLRDQKWQRYHVKDTERGPMVCQVKWTTFWRKEADGLPVRRHCLIVTRNVLTGEVKYFVSNRVPGDRGGVKRVTLRWLLTAAYGRWSVESCFREAKEELGLDHYEVRGWRCVRRHFFLTQLSHLFCARMRQQYDTATTRGDPRLTMEQVRRAVNVWLQQADARLTMTERFERELAKQEYHQRRNAQARKSHTATRKDLLASLDIDFGRIKTCVPPSST